MLRSAFLQLQLCCAGLRTPRCGSSCAKLQLRYLARMTASKPSAISERELYYRLMNIDIYPEALKDARKFVNAAHKQTEAYLEGRTASEDDKRFEYTEVCLRHYLSQKATRASF